MSDELITYVIGQLRGACWEEEAAAVEALVKERDFILANQTYSYLGKNLKRWLARDLEDAKDEALAKLSECEARLGKAVEALRETGEVIIFHTDETSWRVWGEDVVGDIRAVLAELEGEK